MIFRGSLLLARRAQRSVMVILLVLLASLPLLSCRPPEYTRANYQSVDIHISGCRVDMEHKVIMLQVAVSNKLSEPVAMTLPNGVDHYEARRQGWTTKFKRAKDEYWGAGSHRRATPCDADLRVLGPHACSTATWSIYSAGEEVDSNTKRRTPGLGETPGKVAVRVMYLNNEGFPYRRVPARLLYEGRAESEQFTFEVP